MLFSIITPTFNRGSLLNHLYSSLLNQTFSEYEWIIVDDGSTDNTKQIIGAFILDSKIKIKYIYQNNHGKHVAVNAAVKIASGEYCFIIDSDDFLPKESLEITKKWIDSIKNENDYDNFAGVAGIKAFPNNTFVGTTFRGLEYIDCTSLDRYKHRIKGDKAEVFKTDVLRRFPFPVFEGENFITEYVVWYRIANLGLKIRWFNEIIYNCDYLANGLSNTTGKCTRNYQGFKLTVKELIKYKGVPQSEKIKNLIACSAICKEKKESISNLSNELGYSRFLLHIYGFIGMVIRRFR